MELGYSQRTISPYASPPITLLLGHPSEPQARYAIPKSLLTAFPTSQVIQSHNPCESILPLPDISSDIGHTLVHYLHTGEYETLSLPSSHKPGDSHHREYQRAVRTYSTARKYALPDLASLSQGHIIRFSTLLSPAQILDVVREVYPDLTNDDWFRVYMESMIINACRDDSGFLVSDAFLSAFGKGDDIRFDRFLMQIALDVAVKIAREKAEKNGSGSCSPFRDFRANGNSNSITNGDSHSHWNGSCEEPMEDFPRETLYGTDEGMWEHVEEHQVHYEPQSEEEEPEPEPESEPELGHERDPADCYGPVKEPETGVVPEERLLDSMDRPLILDEPEPQPMPDPEPEYTADREPSPEPEQPEWERESLAEPQPQSGPEQPIPQEDLTGDTIPLESPAKVTLQSGPGPEPEMESGPGPSTESPSPIASPSTGKKKKKNKKKKKKVDSAQSGALPNLINV